MTDHEATPETLKALTMRGSCPDTILEFDAHASAWEADRARLLEVERAAKALADKMDAVHESEAYRSVWTVSQLHVGPYRGPKYEDELAALRRLVGGDKP